MSDNNMTASTPDGIPTVADNAAVEAYLESLRRQAEPEGQRTEPRLMDLGPVGSAVDPNDPGIVEDPDPLAQTEEYPDLIEIFDKAVVIRPKPVTEVP